MRQQASIQRSQRVVQPYTLNTADNCQTVTDQIKNHKDQLKNRAAGGKHEAACLSPAQSTRKMSANDTVPDPDWCTPDTVVITRHAACGMGTFQLHVYDVNTGAEVGGMTVGQLGYMFTDMFTDPNLIDWQYQASQQFTGIWDAAIGTTVTATGQCDGDCTTSSQQWPTQVATEDGFWEGYVDGESTTYQPGEIGSGTLEATATFTNPNWLAPVVTSGATPAVRCDNMFSTSIAAGCVVPQVTPEMFYELNGPYPELAQHIQYAQQVKGLPGATPDRPLTRTTDSVAQDRNTAVACPASFPKNPGQDCDEYPFKSTWEGAAFGPYDEAINSTQNQQGGNALLQFYNNERVLNHDPFVVTIV